MSNDLPPNACLLVLMLFTRTPLGLLPAAHGRPLRVADTGGANAERTLLYPPSTAQQDRWLTPEDLRVTQNLRDGLARQVMDTNPDDIRISTRNGVVTLHGAVKDDRERRQIADLVRATPGAVHFNNALELR